MDSESVTLVSDGETEPESSGDMFVIFGYPADLAVPYSDWIDWRQPVPDDVTYIPRRVNLARIIVGAIVAMVVLACIGLILYTIIFGVISANANEWESGTILAIGFLIVSGIFALLLFGAYGLYVSMSAWAEMKVLHTRLRGRFRYGLYLGEDALLAWLNQGEECIGVSRSLLKSAAMDDVKSGRSTIPVIRVNFVEDPHGRVDTGMGCLEFLGDSLEMADWKAVDTINEWIRSP